MKIAISLPDDLFMKIEEIAKERHLSRSRIFKDAASEYVEKRSNLKMLEVLNQVYSEPDTTEERKIRKQGKRRYRQSIESEKW